MTKLKFICCKGGHNVLPTGRLGRLSKHDITGAHERISNSDIDILMGRALAWEISIHSVLTQADQWKWPFNTATHVGGAYQSSSVAASRTIRYAELTV